MSQHFAMLKRSEIREQFGIKGNGCGDFCTTYCCLCCALIQQNNEVKFRTQQGPVTQGYQSQKEGMHIPGEQSLPPPQEPMMGQPPAQQQPLPQ